MAYALRYYKELTHEDGSAHRLEIHKKDSTAEAVEIGAVIQGLSLEIQGSQGDVDSPIVKTSLSMTFVDASDIENGQKNGFWEEFYTPDALLWKVILKARNAQETAFRTMWGGYVTPDSFSEDLVYRGSVNIIARDNIGHMQDFPFDAVGDADGLISLRNLVESGWEKIQSPMVLDWRGETESNMWLICNGVSAPDTLMNVSQFEGMNWYKAIESALASYGIVMRWVGDNIVNVSSLRSMPLQGREYYDNLSYITPVFVAGAQRELVPAVKRIEESVDYEVAESVSAPQVQSSDFTGETDSIVLSTSSGVQFTLEGWYIKNEEEGAGWVNNSVSVPPYFYPSGYDLSGIAEDSHDPDFMWFAFSQYITGDNRFALYSRRMMSQAVSMRMAFGPAYRLVDGALTPLGGARADYAMIAVEVVHDGNSFFLQEDGSWGDTLELLTYNNEKVSNGEIVVDLPTGEFDGGIILNIRVYEAGYYSWAQDTYVPLYSLDFSANNVVLEKNTVNTVYNADNNVILSRSPEIGPAYDSVALPGFVKNGIFVRNGDEIVPARAWAWSGGSEQQMAVWNHLQLLCYYAKPNNLISGTIVNADLTSARAIYQWHGAEHLLVSGRYNFLRGQIESAVLREFARYEDMWSEVAGAAMPDTEEDSTTNVEGGASSGGSSSTYTSTTTVNIGSGGSGGGASYLNDLLDVNVDSVSAQSVLYYNGTEWVSKSVASLLSPYAKGDDLLALSTLLASMWSIDDDGNLVTDKQVIIKNNLIVEGDSASGGEGEDNNASSGLDIEQLQNYLDANEYVTASDLPKSLSDFENDLTFSASTTAATLMMTDGTLEGATQFTGTIGAPARPVYINAGVPTACTYPLTYVGSTLVSTGTTRNYILGTSALTTNAVTATQKHSGLYFTNTGILFAPQLRVASPADIYFTGTSQTLSGILADIASGGSIDLTGYATEQWVLSLGYLTSSALSGYATQSWVESKGYALTSALNSYLPKSGGTLSADRATVLNINNNAQTSASDFVAVRFLHGGSVRCGIGGSNYDEYLYRSNAAFSDVYKIYDTQTLTKSVVTGLLGSNTYAPYHVNGYLPLSGGIMTGTLTIEGASVYLSNERSLYFKDNAGSNRNGLYISAGNYMWLGYDNRTDIKACIAGSEVRLYYGGVSNIGLLLNSSGNVGIGTSSPAYKLDVNGAGRFTGALTIGGTSTLNGALTVNAGTTINGNLVVMGDVASVAS